MLANFERLPANSKVSLGRTLLAKLQASKDEPTPKELWALSRFGARRAMYGPLDRLIPASEAARLGGRTVDLAADRT